MRGSMRGSMRGRLRGWLVGGAALTLIAASGTGGRAAHDGYYAPGLYIGAFTAWMGTDFDISGTRGIPPGGVAAEPLGGTADASGFGGGLIVGYDWARGGIIFGWSLDASLGNWGGDSNGDQYHVDWLVTLRGRVGGYVRDDLLLYGTFGLGWEAVEFNDRTQNKLRDVSSTLVGWTVGAGLDWHIHAGWTASIEYLYLNFGDWRFNNEATAATTSATAGGALTQSTALDSHQVRLGVKVPLSDREYRPVDYRDGYWRRR